MLINIWNFIRCDLVDWITLIVEIVGIIFVYITLRKDKKIKEAEFITEYNFQFISSQPLIDMERKLENCYQRYENNLKKEDGAVNYQVAWAAMVEIMGFSPLSESQGVSRNYQKMINYLVYWEAFAPLILSGHVKLEAIDDAFGYRYFIAMNNPVVQKYELLKEADYYCGCLRLYEKWYWYRKESNKKIPLEDFALCHIGKGDPLEENPVYFMNSKDDEAAVGDNGFMEKYKKIACSQCESKCKKDKGKREKCEETVSD